MKQQLEGASPQSETTAWRAGRDSPSVPTKSKMSTARSKLHIAETSEVSQMFRSRVEALLPPRFLDFARAAELSERHLLTLAK